ncbi:DUF4362 domain-containing protein [Cohnella xylanilytica]|uniref:DUF4362 domain-containing protein n=1 Tax=Cohnella xylanilytica TaxID=557555 RepID=A0A841U9E2_9BACL|nr:DUF4362 domain-containing protein [Cohnella xylanilytica]MBB6694611.1 DUF4362 domain-containing protein [Cohnella xylanilytica]
MPGRVRSAILWTGLLAALWALVGCSASKDPETEGAGTNVLIRFGKSDYVRANEFVRRFEEGRGDILYIVAPTVDSGPIIYDLVSDGRKVEVRRDDTRDAHGSSAGQTTFSCQAIGWTSKEGRPYLTVSQCEGEAEERRLAKFDRSQK